MEFRKDLWYVVQLIQRHFARSQHFVVSKSVNRSQIAKILVATALLFGCCLVFVGYKILQHIDDAYAEWGASEMVIDYMQDHDGEWPTDWNSLKPYFGDTNGRVNGDSFLRFQARVYIDFRANSEELRQLAIASDEIPFDVIHATSMWAARMDGGPNGILYRHFREAHSH